MKLFTAVDEMILRHLGYYKYLTLSQLAKLGVGDKTYLSTRMKMLRTEGLVSLSEYGGVYKKGHGRAQNISYLTPKGAKVLAENTKGLDIATIHYPKNIEGAFRNDYFHRISTVNCQIALDLWTKQHGYESLFFHTYFHKLGSTKKAKEDNPLRSITRVIFPDSSFIEPDAIFMYDTPTKRQFMVLEVSNGLDTTRIVEQNKKIANAVAKGLFTELYKDQYNIQISPRILCTLETDSMLSLVLKRMSSDPFFNSAWIEKAFFFQVAENVWNDFGSGWVNIQGESINLLDL